MKLQPITVRPCGFRLAGSLLAIDPGLSVDATAMVGGRVGQDFGGTLKIAVDLICEMPAPSPPEAVVALAAQGSAEMNRAFHAEPLVVLDVSNNAALLSLLAQTMPLKRIIPVSIGAGEAEGVVPSVMPVAGTDGRTRHVSRWQVSRNGLLNNLEVMGSNHCILLPSRAEQPDLKRLQEQMRATSIAVTASGRRRLEVPARVHDDVLMALAMLAWAAPRVLRAAQWQDRAHSGERQGGWAAWV